MLRDFLKVEKEDRLVEQQDACSGKVMRRAINAAIPAR